ncbi:MAG TPA: hypothetical protein VI007_09665 [bacterium]
MKKMHVGHGLIILAAVLAVAMWPVAAQAQLRAPVQLSDGTLQVLDCEDSAFMFSTREGSVQFMSTQLTAFFAGSDRLDKLCALTPYMGTRLRVWWVSVDGVRVAGRVQVLVFPGQAVLGGSQPNGDHDDVIGSGDDGGSGGNGGSGDDGGSGGNGGSGDDGGSGGNGGSGDDGGSGGGDSGNSGGNWPGHGHGDSNHDHQGPPGHTGDKPGNGNDGSGAPGQQGK